MNDTTVFQQAVDKGNRFFARGNFPLAKQAFAEALAIQEADFLREKVALCEREMMQAKRKDVIRKGRRLEKKGKFVEARQCFAQAWAWEAEEWLQNKLDDLQGKCTLAAVTEKLSQAENTDDLEVRIAAYDEVLAVGADTQIIDNKAECLLTLGRYGEVVALYRRYPPEGDRSRYYCGLALAEQGEFIHALTWWVKIEVVSPSCQQQRLQLLPFVYRELCACAVEKPVFFPFYALFRDQEVVDPALSQYVAYFKSRVVAELWEAERYDELKGMFLPFPDHLSIPSLGWYARLYFKLAQQSVDHLQTAISLWLTAIHQKTLIDGLATHTVLASPIDSKVLQGRLLQQMEQLLTQYERAGALPAAIRPFWQFEKRLLETLQRLPVLAQRPDWLPCTPSFAVKFDPSGQMFQFLREHRHTLDDKSEAFQELLAAFSPYGASLVLLEQGQDDAALAAIPMTARDDLADYCRQRVYWVAGIKKLRQGDQNARKQLIAARALMQIYPAYGEELIKIAFEDLSDRTVSELADIMEMLTTHLTSPKFKEAAAYVMGTKALILIGTSNSQSIEKILDKANTFDPNSEMVVSVREKLQEYKISEQVSRAMRKNQLEKAVQIILESNDQRSKERFMKTVARWAQEMQMEDVSPSILERDLRKFHKSCLLLDRYHPVTVSIGRQLALVGVQK